MGGVPEYILNYGRVVADSWEGQWWAGYSQLWIGKGDDSGAMVGHGSGWVEYSELWIGRGDGRAMVAVYFSTLAE